MQETNKLSNDDTYLVVRDNGGDALVHTDTFAAQKGFAKLATDAAGNPAGLPNAANVLTSAPSAMLYSSSGLLMCNGLPVRDIGVCAYQLLTDYLSGTNQNFLTEFPLLARHGFKFVRVMGGPLWPSEWTATYTADKTGYYDKVKTFLDCAAEYGLGIVLSVFWRHATQCDLAGETVSVGIGTAGSATRTRVATIISEYASRFASHPAFAAWEIGNEYSLFAANGSLPTVNVGKGTPAAYNNPADVTTLAAMRDFYTFVGTQIKAADTTGRVILTGNGGPGGVIEKGIETYRGLVPLDNPDPIDTLSIHKYSRNEFGNRAYADLTDTLAEMLALSRFYKKPFVLGEFGMERNETYGGYGGDSVFRTACEAIFRSGIQLAFAWNWAQDTGTGANNFNFHPLNTANGTNTKAEILKEFQTKMRRDANFWPCVPPVSAKRRTGQNIYVPAGGNAVLLSAADAAVLKPTGAFAVSFWVKQTRGDLTNRRIARKYGGNAGWYIGLDASNPDRTVFMQLQYSDGTTQNLGGQCQQIQAGAWRHYVFQFDSNSGNGTYGVSCFENGRWVKTLTPTAGKTWNPSTDLLYIFGDAGPSNVSYVGLKDFRLHNRALTDEEVRNLYLYDTAPLGTIVGEWKFDGTLTDSSGNANNLSIASGTPAYETFSQ